ncbi:MAG: hypothetical protein QM755_07310 [Luteolibacter sp.]
MKRGMMLLLAMAAMAEPAMAGQVPAWTEYEIEMVASENRQPTMIIRWFSDQVPGAACEYPEIWRTGMTFGRGKRLKVASLRGVNKDGFQIPGKTVEVSVLDTVTKKTIQFYPWHQDLPELFRRVGGAPPRCVQEG